MYAPPPAEDQSRYQAKLIINMVVAVFLVIGLLLVLQYFHFLYLRELPLIGNWLMDIYERVFGVPKVLILHGDDSLGDWTALRDGLSQRLIFFSEDVDVIVAPGVEGELGILPHHTPLMTMLQPGELRVKKDGEEFSLAISGGFLEVRPDRVIVLADAAERVEEIDVARAEEAKRRAQERLRERAPGLDMARAEAGLRRSMARLEVVARRRKRRPGT